MSVNTLVNNELQRVAGSDSRHVDYNMQISTMPEASAQYANLIFQYVGTTDENYTNGYFYKCFVNEETTPTSYTWKVLKLNTLPITSYKELQEYWGLGGDIGVSIIQRADWNLLTESQKQALGIVAIQDSSSGFNIGELVNGAEYIQSNKYIPYTDEEDVRSVAYADLFDANEESWGYGECPVLYTGTGSGPSLSTQEHAVYFPTNTSDVVGYIDLGRTGAAFTVYIVMKAAASSPGRLISCFANANQGDLIMFSGDGNNVSIDNWGNGTNLGVSAVSDYFVAAMTSTGYGAVYNPSDGSISAATKALNSIGRYLTIARTDINVSVPYPAPTDVYLKYIAVVNEAESSTVIGNNLTTLYQQFVAT